MAGEPTRPFRYRDKGTLATIGRDSSQLKASSSIERPRSAQNFSSFSTIAQFASVM